MGMVSAVFREEVSRYTFNMSVAAFWRVLLVAFLAGLITWAAGLALEQYAFTPMFCGTDNASSACINSSVIAANTAAVLVGVMTVPFLVMVQVKRALLVAAAAVTSLWGISVLGDFVWWMSLLWTVLTYVVIYATLVWITRIRGDLAAITLMTLFALLARVVLSL